MINTDANLKLETVNILIAIGQMSDEANMYYIEYFPDKELIVALEEFINNKSKILFEDIKVYTALKKLSSEKNIINYQRFKYCLIDFLNSLGWKCDDCMVFCNQQCQY